MVFYCSTKNGMYVKNMVLISKGSKKLSTNQIAWFFNIENLRNSLMVRIYLFWQEPP